MSPRRMLLLLAGVLAFGVVYTVYARALGWLDGLPQLPAAMLNHRKGDFIPPPRLVSPTVERLKEAFGDTCREQDDQAYPTKLEFRNGESSIVLASGTPPFTGEKRVTLSPFSLAVFGKPRPALLRQPGEVTEISTFHADKAVLEFDTPINGIGDMNKAKLLRLELVSDPENVPPFDPRNGTVHITNNQRSADPNRALVLRTPGPVFYRDPKAVRDGGTGPDVWTDAAVEVVDKQNLPRGFAAVPAPTAPARGEDLRDATAVGDILTGGRRPPPTVTAVGMRVYLEPEKPSTVPNPPAPKKGSAGVSGVRRVELLEKVLINLWVDASQSLVSEPPKAGAEKDKDKKPAPRVGGPLAEAEPPPEAAGALVGGLLHGVQTTRRLDKALLQIETLGPFAYDVEKNTARFDVLPQADPGLLNDVQVTRTPARGGQHRRLSQLLEIEFNGPPTGPPPSAPQPPGSAPEPPAGPTFKQLHAWTYTPGRYLTVSAEGEQLEAYGFDLVHDQAANRSVLRGAPLYAVRERNVLTAGGPQKPGTLVMQPGPDER